MPVFKGKPQPRTQLNGRILHHWYKFKKKKKAAIQDRMTQILKSQHLGGREGASL